MSRIKNGVLTTISITIGYCEACFSWRIEHLFRLIVQDIVQIDVVGRPREYVYCFLRSQPYLVVVPI